MVPPSPRSDVSPFFVQFLEADCSEVRFFFFSWPVQSLRLGPLQEKTNGQALRKLLKTMFGSFCDRSQLLVAY
jgi:hypothetical protein